MGKFNVGFTLAEILITLSIIGVIASMTIPSLVHDVQEAQFKAGYKKAFATASQAWKMAFNDKLIFRRTDFTDYASNNINFNAFRSKFNIVKDCNTGNNSDCWAKGEMWTSSTPYSDARAFIDSSGMAWSMRAYQSLTTYTNYVLLDVNGFKGPNKYGKDRFVLRMATDVDSGSGIPIKISPQSDVASGTECPSGNCFFTSWLKD